MAVDLLLYESKSTGTRVGPDSVEARKYLYTPNAVYVVMRLVHSNHALAMVFANVTEQKWVMRWV